MFKNYDELLNHVLAISNEIEKVRIQEENDLIKSREWEEYIVFLANLLLRLEHNMVCLNKSSLDSYLLYKCRNSELNTKLLNGIKEKEIFFNDALRLNVEVVGIKQVIRQWTLSASKVLAESIKTSGLNYFESVDGVQTIQYSEQTIILSKEEITDEIKNAVLYENKESSDAEANLLYKVLIIKFISRLGI